MAVRVDHHLALVAHDARVVLVGEDDVDAILGRRQRRGITYRADPRLCRVGEHDTDGGDRGLYSSDPGGHHLEVITRRYGSGG